MSAQQLDIEDIYELSPLQQGLLFITLRESDPAVYFQQSSRLMEGLDVDAFCRAWQRVVDRHPTLRTSFHWEGLEKPVQVVHRRLEVPVERQDLRCLAPDEQQRRVRAFMQADRRRGFSLSEAPLLRVGLLQLTDENYFYVCSQHHIVLDGWSTPVLNRELTALYQALRRGEDAALPPPQPFREYIAWLQRQDLSQAEGFWREYLRGYTIPTPLPLDQRTGSRTGPRGGQLLAERLELPAELAESLRALARRERLTLNVIVQAAWAVLLGRYSGRQDVTFGMTVSGRPPTLPGVEAMIGLFINTLPVRVPLGTVEGVLPWLKGLQARQAEMAQYEYSPLAQVQGWSEVPRTTPLFESLFVFQNFSDERPARPAPNGRPHAGGKPQQPQKGAHEVAYPLTLVAMPTAEGLTLLIRGDSNRFTAEILTRLLEQMRVILSSIAVNPGQQVGELSPLSAQERWRVLYEWNRTDASYPSPLCLHQLFARQAAQTPEAIALSCEGRQLTYRELDHLANRLARRLHGRGIGPDTIVALCAQRSAKMVVGLLGILKAGAAYLPLDPDYPAERLAYMLEDSQAPVVLVQAALRDRLPPRAETLSLEEALAEPADGSEPEGPPAAAVVPDNLAYVIYTSGSTGRPKGVAVTHANVLRLFTATDEWFHFGPADVWTLFHSYAFDFSVWELWGALLYGGRLVVVPYWVSRSPNAFYELLARERVTVLNQTPSAFRQLIRAEEEQDGALPLALRFVIFGGEALDFNSLRPWSARHGLDRPQLVNMYGITETTVHVTYYPLTDADVAHPRASVIGGPIPDLQVYVLDANMQPVPVGVPGELYVGGAGLARGYLGRPELTATRLIPDPFSGRPGARLYRSGDGARWAADGSLEYLGRLDQQVKVRGFRIELGEIESQLSGCPHVREAVVVARDDADGDKRLVGYVVPSNGQPPTAGEMRAQLRTRLPDYMVPADFVVLPALPLTSNGKVDRRALPEPGTDRPELNGHYVAPRNDLERLLAGRVAEVLGLERVGAEDNFFDLGGNSIKAAVLVNQLQHDLGETLYVVALFDAPTVSGLADYLRRNYPRPVARLLGGPSAEPVAQAAGKVTTEHLAEFRRLADHLPPRPGGSHGRPGKNRPVVFVLSTPRSGSTLLRVLLGGNSRMFSPPELDLLLFNTLADRRAAFTGGESFRLEGLIRAVMEIRGCGPDEAKGLVEGWERQGHTIKWCYGQLQDWLGERVLVDKTPAYALDLDALRRAEEDFDGARYLHLVRHPGGMINSFEEIKLEQIFFRHDHRFTPRQLAELIWVVSQQNILKFLRDVPASRQCRVRFEDVVHQPEEEMQRLCAFLGLTYDPAMAQPYQDRNGRMTDGIHPESRMLGDIKFHQYRGIEAGVADRWREKVDPESLADFTWDLAEALGYERPGHTRRNGTGGGGWLPVERTAPKDDAEQTLERLDQLSEAEIESLLGEALAQERETAHE
jgi:amino acid adenylation domain-containing protein